MGEVVNLRRARKQLKRAAADDKAAANRAKFGRTRAEKARDEDAAERLSRAQDQAKLEE